MGMMAAKVAILVDEMRSEKRANVTNEMVIYSAKHGWHGVRGAQKKRRVADF